MPSVHKAFKSQGELAEQTQTKTDINLFDFQGLRKNCQSSKQKPPVPSRKRDRVSLNIDFKLYPSELKELTFLELLLPVTYVSRCQID